MRHIEARQRSLRRFEFPDEPCRMERRPEEIRRKVVAHQQADAAERFLRRNARHIDPLRFLHARIVAGWRTVASASSPRPRMRHRDLRAGAARCPYRAREPRTALPPRLPPAE